MTGNQTGSPCPFCEISTGRAPAVIVHSNAASALTKTKVDIDFLYRPLLGS